MAVPLVINPRKNGSEQSTSRGLEILAIAEGLHRVSHQMVAIDEDHLENWFGKKIRVALNIVGYLDCSMVRGIKWGESNSIRGR